MGYFVEIVVCAPPGPESDEGMPAVRLPDEFPSFQAATDAAQAYMREHHYGAGRAFYNLFDEAGNIVVDQATRAKP